MFIAIEVQGYSRNLKSGLWEWKLTKFDLINFLNIFFFQTIAHLEIWTIWYPIVNVLLKEIVT